MKIIKEIGRDPHVDWIAILFVSGAIALGLAIGGYYLYNAVTSGGIEGEESAPNSSFTKLDEKAVSSVIDRFAVREEISKKARAGYVGAADPSI